MYIDAEGRKYKSYEEYVNSPDLDLDFDILQTVEW